MGVGELNHVINIPLLDSFLGISPSDVDVTDYRPLAPVVIYIDTNLSCSTEPGWTYVWGGSLFSITAPQAVAV